jgi:hypothetical protein
MANRKPSDEQVERAVERAETAEEKAEAARVRAAELAQARLRDDQDLAARAAAQPGATTTTTVAAPATADDGTVEVTLAHSLSEYDRRQHHLGDQDLAAGATIRVRREVKNALVAAGYAAGIEPASLATGVPI